MSLTLSEANRMVQAGIEKAEQLGVGVSIAVSDAGGNLLAFNRMAGASSVSATVAHRRLMGDMKRQEGTQSDTKRQEFPP